MGQNSKQGQHPKSKANLRRGRTKAKPRTILSERWNSFCVYYRKFGVAARAAIHAGFSPGTAWKLLNDPRIQNRLRELEAEEIKKKVEHVEKEFDLTVAMVDAEAYHLLVNAQNEIVKLRAAIACWRRLGLIPEAGARIVNNNSPTQIDNPQLIYARRLYLPEWRKQAIEQAKQLESGDTAVPPIHSNGKTKL